MTYWYYPGCSLEGTAQEYDLATRALMRAAGMELRDLPDWTCCGATAAETISEMLSLALPARNLALVEKTDPGLDILVPCSACYLNLKRAESAARSQPGLKAEINKVLASVGLEYQGRTRVRHILDVLSRDLGSSRLSPLVRRPLENLTLAPYYGCQCLRPYAGFDDPESPVAMVPLIEATGAKVHPWSMGGRCCGASNVTTKPQVGLELVAAILSAAQGADAIVTVCPMCQLNLEAHQSRISRKKGRDLTIDVLYLPQLLGLALGLTPAEVRLDLNLALSGEFRREVSSRISGRASSASGGI